MKTTVLSIVGARPQFIKLFPLSREVRKHFDEKIIHTGQHFDPEMSDTFFRELGIPEPDINLGINQGGHGDQTGRMLISLEKQMTQLQPDLVIVFGDTNTTLAGALAAAKLHIPTVHVEAGLRSFNRTMPEEINRVVSDHTADHLFAPTQSAIDNLAHEGLQDRTHHTGDIMVDASRAIAHKARQKSSIFTELDLDGSYMLMTLHRPYNVDDTEKLSLIFRKLGEVDHTIVFPIHPRTRKMVDHHRITIPGNIRLIRPLGYLDFTSMLVHAEKIITDSGGIQKEAYIHKKPCLTVRPETEWTETVTDGWNRLIQPGDDNFTGEIRSFRPHTPQSDIFGRDVARTMVEVIQNHILTKEKK